MEKNARDVGLDHYTAYELPFLTEQCRLICLDWSIVALLHRLIFSARQNQGIETYL